MTFPFSEIEAEQKTHGPQRRFSTFHYFKALKFIEDAGKTGRKRLSEELGIGEGSTRTLLNMLEQRSLISRNNAGIELTQRGRKVLSSFPFSIQPLPPGSLPFSGEACISIVRNGAGKVTNGIMQRDEAVRAGGSGAITLVVRDGRLLIPPDMLDLQSDIVLRTARSMGACDSDAVVIGLGNRRLNAELAAFYASTTLCE